MDPFANIPALDCDALTALADVSDHIEQPFDDAPTFDASTSPEVDITAGLATDKALIRSPRRRLFVDYRAHPAAFKHLEDLPGPWETLHGVISGKYALWDLVPALIERTGQDIAHLTLATLSFSKANAADLLGLIDGGQIGRVSLLVSYYFKSTNQEIYDSLVPELRTRGHKCLAMRTHCKIILAEMADGTRFTVESSANLRSCKNVEQFALTNDAALYEFHHGWIQGELMAGVEVDTNGRQ